MKIAGRVSWGEFSFKARNTELGEPQNKNKLRNLWVNNVDNKKDSELLVLKSFKGGTGGVVNKSKDIVRIDSISIGEAVLVFETGIDFFCSIVPDVESVDFTSYNLDDVLDYAVKENSKKCVN